jgi:hypothetical protein
MITSVKKEKTAALNHSGWTGSGMPAAGSYNRM